MKKTKLNLIGTIAQQLVYENLRKQRHSNKEIIEILGIHTSQLYKAKENFLEEIPKELLYLIKEAFETLPQQEETKTQIQTFTPKEEIVKIKEKPISVKEESNNSATTRLEDINLEDCEYYKTTPSGSFNKAYDAISTYFKLNSNGKGSMSDEQTKEAKERLKPEVLKELLTMGIIHEKYGNIFLD